MFCFQMLLNKIIQYSNYGIINYFIPYLFLFWRDDEPLLWSSTPLLYWVLLFSSTLLRTEDERIWSSPLIKEHPVPSPTTSFVSSFGGILVLWLLLISFSLCLFTNQQLLTICGIGLCHLLTAMQYDIRLHDFVIWLSYCVFIILRYPPCNKSTLWPLEMISCR